MYLFGLARAETRRSRGTLLFCVLSVAIGVASLTAVRSILDSLNASLAGQARQILGGDLMLSGNDPLDDGAGAKLSASLNAAGAKGVDVVEMASMLYAPDGKERATALVEVRAIGDGYPLYGDIATEPAGMWQTLGDAPRAVVDPKLYDDLGIGPGDTILLGELSLEVAGAFVVEPGTPVATFGFSPAIYIHYQFLDDTELVRTGSRISYRRVFRLPDDLDAESWKAAHWDQAVAGHVNIRTSRESAARVQRFLGRLSQFLTVVGLVTLLLGGLGIGAAMNVFLRGKLDNAAVLRCVGARPRQVFVVYGLVALGVGLVGSAIGIAIGALVPLLLGGAVGSLGGDLLPAEIALAPTWRAGAHGLFAGLLATAAFAMWPVWRAGKVSPLRVMRRDVDAGGRGRRLGDLPVFALFVSAIGAAVLALAAVETGSFEVAAYFTAAVAMAVGLLAIASRLVMAAARRAGPRLPGYRLRQGIANLHRPGNQTASVLTAVGVGVLLVSTIFIIEASLQKVLAIDDREELPNVFLIDIQPDQKPGVEKILREANAEDPVLAPMIAARIAAINGTPIETSNVNSDARDRSWADRMRTREYFVTYRDHLIDSETLLEGTFWNGRPETQEVSVDEDLVRNLGVSIGDTLTLDIQGIPLDATVTSVRRIRWRAMRPNALIVLSPGPIEKAPKMFIGSFRIDGSEQRQAIQEQLVRAYPNLSVVDITEAAQTVRFILGRISAILGFMALLTVVTGGVILGGAVAAGRFARLREAMLLKVLGASRRDLRRILVAEYAVLAALGGLCGWGLAELINRPALARLFEVPVTVPYRALVALVAAVVAGNVIVGMLLSRGVSSARPLDVLRDE